MPRRLSRPLALSGGEPLVRADQYVRWPVLGAEERAAVLGVLERGVLSGSFAPEVRGLEREWASYLGSEHCIATNSGTAALHVAITAAGIGPGDQVIAEGVEALLWQSKPVPAQGLFRDKAGFGGRACPWDLGPPVDYDLAQDSESIRLLESSFVLFSHTCPIAPQPPAVVDAYAEAFEQVWERLDEVVATAG